jgi:hypothetical protein
MPYWATGGHASRLLYPHVGGKTQPQWSAIVGDQSLLRPHSIGTGVSNLIEPEEKEQTFPWTEGVQSSGLVAVPNTGNIRLEVAIKQILCAGSTFCYSMRAVLSIRWRRSDTGDRYG